jgi:hypothetical protein
MSQLLQHLASTSPFWQNYTSDETWLPLLLPCILWTSAWIHRTFVVKQSYANYYEIHGFHHVVAILMGLTSMYVNDDTLFNERIVILWSLGYFVVDIVDCVLEREYTFLFHGIISFICGLLNYNLPLMRGLRMNSKAALMETSSIVLHQAQKTKDQLTFVVFGILFTACRIVWIPIMMKELYENDAHWSILGLLAVFYVLQVHWWIKIIKIMIRGPRKKDDKKGKETKDSDDETKKSVNIKKKA